MLVRVSAGGGAFLRHYAALMTILVDDLREYPHTRLPFRQWCHLVSDTSFDELHEFAARIDIPRHRFQGDHYDLPPHVRARAVENGACEVTTRELTRRMAGPRGDRVRVRRAARGRE
jgi:uncharacterized protein DUF4031